MQDIQQEDFNSILQELDLLKEKKLIGHVLFAVAEDFPKFSKEISQVFQFAQSAYEFSKGYYTDLRHELKKSSNASKKCLNEKVFANNFCHLIDGSKVVISFDGNILYDTLEIDDEQRLLAIALLCCSKKFLNTYSTIHLSGGFKQTLNYIFTGILDSVEKSKFGVFVASNENFLALKKTSLYTLFK